MSQCVSVLLVMSRDVCCTAQQREEQRLRKLEEHRKDVEYFAEKPVHQYNYDYKQAGALAAKVLEL